MKLSTGMLSNPSFPAVKVPAHSNTAIKGSINTGGRRMRAAVLDSWDAVSDGLLQMCLPARNILAGVRVQCSNGAAQAGSSLQFRPTLAT
jgi:hypothetical protein